MINRKTKKVIENIAQNCTFCINLNNNSTKVDTHDWEWPIEAWQRIYIILVLLWKMLVLVMNGQSKWPEVFIFPYTTSKNTIICFRSLFTWNSFTISLVSDNSKQFTSEEFGVFFGKITELNIPLTIQSSYKLTGWKICANS